MSQERVRPRPEEGTGNAFTRRPAQLYAPGRRREGTGGARTHSLPGDDPSRVAPVCRVWSLSFTVGLAAAFSPATFPAHPPRLFAQAFPAQLHGWAGRRLCRQQMGTRARAHLAHAGRQGHIGREQAEHAAAEATPNHARAGGAGAEQPLDGRLDGGG
jgi:hypothetical protein